MLQYREISPEDYDALSRLPSRPVKKLDQTQRGRLIKRRFEAAAPALGDRCCASAEGGATTAERGASSAPLEDHCVICMQEMLPEEVLSSLSCDHTFHSECLDGWLDHSSACPTCRDVLGDSLEDSEA